MLDVIGEDVAGILLRRFSAIFAPDIFDVAAFSCFTLPLSSRLLSFRPRINFGRFLRFDATRR